MKTRSYGCLGPSTPALTLLLFLATLTAGFGQPTITSQPQTQAVAPGTTATFTVGASGTEPLAYQWQRNLGAGFADLANGTNARLALTNVQTWDATDYRVVVTNLGGARTSAVAHLYVLGPALLTNTVVLDNFDDNQLSGWVTYGPGQKALFETNQQLTVWGYWPGVVTRTWNTYTWGLKSTNWNVGDGQSIEWRADVVRLNQFATASEIVPASWANQVFYATHFGSDFITIVKWAANHEIVFACEAVALKRTNVVLSFTVTRANANAILTARVLDKDQQNAVLYEHSVVDTPQADRSLSSAELLAVSGMNLLCGPDVSAAPYTSGDCVGLGAWQYSDATSLAAEVTYDNMEQWKYKVPTTRYVDAASASPTPPYTNWATAARVIQDAVDVAAPGEEIIVTNGTYAAGGRAVYGTMTNRVAVDKPLTLRSVNGPEVTVIEGAQAPGGGNGDGAIRCVYLTNGASLSGFTLTNGATRGRPADDPERERSGGGVWCESASAVVSNCVVAGNSAGDWGAGVWSGTLNNCTLTGNNGAAGGGGAGYATLNDCTLIGNWAEFGGGGADLSTLNNCTLIGNSAHGTDMNCGGGGAQHSTLNNCTLTANSGSYFGGGVRESTLNNCTLTGNSAEYYGGGAWDSALNNCIVHSNTNGGNYDWCTLNYCCTTPMPTNGVGNITNAPLFVDDAAGNLRLQSNSPCINAGLNAYAPGPTDLEGNPRIVSGSVDIGAYEYQGPGSIISYAWLQGYSLPTDGSADFLDPDADGHNNWQEWRCQTDPTNALSALRLVSATPSPTNADVTVTWQSVAGVTYFLERSTNLASPLAPLASNLPGQPGTTSFADTNAAGLPPLFYRVGVQ